jgi:hypothetical protein
MLGVGQPAQPGVDPGQQVDFPQVDRPGMIPSITPWAGMAWEVLGICWTAVAWRRRPANRRRQPLGTTVN